MEGVSNDHCLADQILFYIFTKDHTMTKNSTFKFVAAFTMAATCLAGAANAKGGNATPFGVEIGGSCTEAKTKLGPVKSGAVGNDDTIHYATNPGAIFDGASELLIRCNNDKVIALRLTAPKGFTNPVARNAYQTLDKLYKRVDGQPIPEVGNGYARFVKGDSVIEIDAPHMTHLFTVGYATRDFYKAANESQTKTNEAKAATRSKL
jgi:hypothetical protein